MSKLPKISVSVEDRLMLHLYEEGPQGRTGENIGIWLNHPIELPPVREVLPSRHP